MVVDESEALRWVAMQWQSLNENDRISGGRRLFLRNSHNIRRILWEFRKNRRQQGDYSR